MRTFDGEASSLLVVIGGDAMTKVDVGENWVGVGESQIVVGTESVSGA